MRTSTYSIPTLVLILLMGMTQSLSAQNSARTYAETLKAKEISPIKWVTVKGGTFLMGATPEQGNDPTPQEYPAHSMDVASFEMGQYEVTCAQFCAFLNAQNLPLQTAKKMVGIGPDTTYVSSRMSGVLYYDNGTYKVRRNFHNYPVENVLYMGAKAFCEWVGGRLPTEQEWEYAARGGAKSKGYKFSGSNKIEEVAWFTENTHDTGSKPVGTKRPNELGLYDMSGNVWEYCSDILRDYTTGKPIGYTYVVPEEDKRNYVVRGGGWMTYSHNCRVTYRIDVVENYLWVGFRVCRNGTK